MLALLPSAGAHKPRSSTDEITKKRSDTKRQGDVEQAAAFPTTPARATHIIEKPRAIRRNKDRRKTNEGKGERLEEEDTEEDEKEYEEDGVGTKRKLKAKGWRQKKAVIHPRVSAHARVADFPGQTFIVEHGELVCQTSRKRLIKDKKTTLVYHCKRIDTSCAGSGGVQEEGNEQVGV